MKKDEKLVLFDIDGTLLYAGKGARSALSGALEEVLEETIKIERGELSGKTDPMIISNFITRAGCMHEEIPLLMKLISQRYLELLKERYKAFDDGHLYPGIMEILEGLSEHAHIYLGLLTGNLEKGARIKLAPYGLNDYFPVGAFGNDGFVRTDLPPVAVNRSESFYDMKFKAENIFVIGDTVDDVMCGKIIHARTIAIARNPNFRPIIKKYDPDFMFESTEEAENVIEAIIN